MKWNGKKFQIRLQKVIVLSCNNVTVGKPTGICAYTTCCIFLLSTSQKGILLFLCTTVKNAI